MPVDRLTVSNYRPLRDLRLDLEPVTVLVGANGCGKSNTYRALGILHAAAQGRLAEAFADEGGIASMTWSGLAKKRDEIRSVRISIEVDFDRYAYRLACGVPIPSPSMFQLNPEVKEEFLGVYVEGQRAPVPLCERQGHIVTLRDEHGNRETRSEPLDPTQSMLVQLVDPYRYPELSLVRSLLAGWRFHHQFRTDPDSPLRKPALAVRSPVLSDDGRNLAATLQTIAEMNGSAALDAAIGKAFSGCRLGIAPRDGNLLALTWHRPDLARPLEATELSDGTLRFLALAAALLTPRPPTLLVLNEPESGLHRDVIPALADLIAAAAEQTQVIVTTHLTDLADGIRERTGTEPTPLVLVKGQTQVGGTVDDEGRRQIRFGRSKR